jgi:anti-anti-sigma regulatory factor
MADPRDTEWPEQLFAELARRVSLALSSRRGTAFHRRGVDESTRLINRLVTMLRQDLAAGNSDRLSAELRDSINDLSKNPIAFRDLRMLATELRSTLLACIAEYPQLDPTAVQKAEDWCHELALQSGLLLITWREEIIGRLATDVEEKIAELRELSIPIAPVYEGVLVVPLVGVLDSYRAEILIERLLDEITRTRARFALLDIGGVPLFNQDVARYLLKVTQATRLLGTELVLVGISPAVAQVISGLDVDVQGLVTLRNLQEGLAYALSRLSRRIVPVLPSS